MTLIRKMMIYLVIKVQPLQLPLASNNQAFSLELGYRISQFKMKMLKYFFYKIQRQQNSLKGFYE